jgi:hypothetical protein
MSWCTYKGQHKEPRVEWQIFFRLSLVFHGRCMCSTAAASQ